MIDERELVERAGHALGPEPPSFDGLLRRRDRKRRNERIAVGIVVTVIALAAVLASLRVPGPHRQPVNRGELPAMRNDGEVLRHACCDGRLEAVDPSTGISRALNLGTNVGDAAWSPNGIRLAYSLSCEPSKSYTTPCDKPASERAGIWVTDATGARTRLTSWYGLGNPGIGGFGWAPDGDRIAYAAAAPDPGLYVANADGSDATFIAGTEGASTTTPVWSHDGSLIAYGVDGHVFVVAPDGGEPRLLADGQAPAWSPDGSRLALAGVGGIDVVNADGSGLTRVGAGYEFAWSPDGSRIVYHIESRSSAKADFHEGLWVVSPDGSNTVNVLPLGCCPGGIVDGGFAWSPDGNRIAFLNAVEENVWVVTRADGNDATKSLSQLDRIDEVQWLSWQPCLCSNGPF
jgi:Tol biopolymer transport system component